MVSGEKNSRNKVRKVSTQADDDGFSQGTARDGFRQWERGQELEHMVAKV